MSHNKKNQRSLTQFFGEQLNICLQDLTKLTIATIATEICTKNLVQRIINNY